MFIATSLDGYIADKQGGLEWLHAIPNPEQLDMGFIPLLNEVDALVMGRTTFETVCGFEGDWPYPKPVFVLSNTLSSIPAKYADKAFLLAGLPADVLKQIHDKGYYTLYIDGGRTIQEFLRADLIDELRITTIPILLGGGFPLFGDLAEPLEWEHVTSTLFLNQLVQNQYRRKR